MFARLTVAMAALLPTLVTAAHAAEKKGGLPQLNVPDMAPQLVWLALTFGILYLVLSRVTLPRIASVIEERQNRIQRDIDDAERLKGETDAAMAAYEQALAEAHGRANAIARETREQLTAEVNEERAKVESELAVQLGEAEARITAMKTQAMAEVGDIAADTAGEVIKKLIGVEVTPDEVRAAVQTSPGE